MKLVILNNIVKAIIPDIKSFNSLEDKLLKGQVNSLSKKTSTQEDLNNISKSNQPDSKKLTRIKILDDDEDVKMESGQIRFLGVKKKRSDEDDIMESSQVKFPGFKIEIKEEDSVERYAKKKPKPEPCVEKNISREESLKIISNEKMVNIVLKDEESGRTLGNVS